MEQKCKLDILYVLVSTLILGISTSISHMAYQWSQQSLIVGLFNPVNESVWEHLKLMFFPNLLWWIFIYLISGKKCGIDLKRWTIASAVSLIVAPLMVIFLYYSYTGATGSESLLADIIIVFVSYFIALQLSMNIYKNTNPGKIKVMAAILIIILLFSAFIIFTFNPPHKPLFYDTTAGTYGIVT